MATPADVANSGATAASAASTYVAVVLGGTGATGRCLVRELVCSERCREVKALVRRVVDAEAVFGLTPEQAADGGKLRQIVVDYEQVAHADAATGGGSVPDGAFVGDVGFSTLGTTRAQAGSAAAFTRVDLDYQVAAAKRMYAGGVRHYVQCSSQGASAASWLLYPSVKGKAEQQCMALGFRGSCSIFRPGLLFTARDADRPRRLGESVFQRILPSAFGIKSSVLASAMRHVAECAVTATASNSSSSSGAVGGSESIDAPLDDAPTPVILENAAIKAVPAVVATAATTAASSSAHA